MPDQTDQVLLRATRRGDEAAARALHSRLAPAMISFARSILRDDGLAEDAVQTAFCRVLTASLREVDRVESAQAWLACIVRREALTIMRTNRRMVQRHRRWADGRDPVFGGESTEGASELQEVGRLVHALPRRLSEVLVLKHVCALTFDEISIALGINRNTAAARYRVGITRLKARLSGNKPRNAQEEKRSHAR